MIFTMIWMRKCSNNLKIRFCQLLFWYSWLTDLAIASLSVIHIIGTSGSFRLNHRNELLLKPREHKRAQNKSPIQNCIFAYGQESGGDAETSVSLAGVSGIFWFPLIGRIVSFLFLVIEFTFFTANTTGNNISSQARILQRNVNKIFHLL